MICIPTGLSVAKFAEDLRPHETVGFWQTDAYKINLSTLKEKLDIQVLFGAAKYPKGKKRGEKDFCISQRKYPCPVRRNGRMFRIRTTQWTNRKILLYNTLGDNNYL